MFKHHKTKFHKDDLPISGNPEDRGPAELPWRALPAHLFSKPIKARRK